jgi:hypothetical protein
MELFQLTESGDEHMSFDALTIMGISVAILCGGFLIALVNRNGGVRSPKR